MVDASDEYRSSLSFIPDDVVVGPQRPPSSWQPPLDLVMIFLKCSISNSLPVGSPSCGQPQRLSYPSLVNCSIDRALGFHQLDSEERGHELTPNGGGPAGMGPPRPGFDPSCTTCHLLHFGLLAPLDVDFECRYPHDQVRGSLRLNFPSFISVLGNTSLKHIGPCHLWRQVFTRSELLD
jgi:hypothetical protein